MALDPNGSAPCGAVLVYVERDADTGAVQSVERVAIIPEQRFYDLTGIVPITCPFTGARTMAIDRSHWAAAALAWRREDMRRHWGDWVRVKTMEFLGFSL